MQQRHDDRSVQMMVTAGELARAIGGQLVVPDAADVIITGVTTDSRSTVPGQVFVALRGERFDGHDFVESAAQAGAVAAVVDRPVSASVAQIVVPDTLVALGKIAAWWRQRIGALVVAVTGSAGKTTTKAMIAEILSRAGPTVSTPGTENNEIGVPLAVLRVRDERFCVLEMGARGRGHVAYLAGIAKPVVGVVTNIGEAHLGLFGSVEKVAEAKGELVEALPEEGRAVLNADDAFFDRLARRAKCPVISFGMGKADFAGEEVRDSEGGVVFKLRCPDGEASVRLALPGLHNVYNALAAAAGAWAAGAELEDIVDGLEAFAGEAMRTEMLRLADGTLVINDAYNASPTSVRAALELLDRQEGRKVFVFGDMLELGEYAQEAHRRVGREAAEKGVAVLLAVGALAALAADEAGRHGVEVHTAADAKQAAAAAREIVRPGDVVLVKASRLVGLEAVVHALQEAGGGG